MTLFERRFEEGYDLKDDSRYNHWLRVFHPENLKIDLQFDLSEIPSVQSSDKVKALNHTTVLEKFLTDQQQSVKIPVEETKTCASVLTSVENRLALEEKEQLKKQKADKKAGRATARILRQQEKAAATVGKNCSAVTKSKGITIVHVLEIIILISLLGGSTLSTKDPIVATVDKSAVTRNKGTGITIVHMLVIFFLVRW